VSNSYIIMSGFATVCNNPQLWACFISSMETQQYWHQIY